jgi:hypothetical protein
MVQSVYLGQWITLEALFSSPKEAGAGVLAIQVKSLPQQKVAYLEINIRVTVHQQTGS